MFLVFSCLPAFDLGSWRGTSTSVGRLWLILSYGTYCRTYMTLGLSGAGAAVTPPGFQVKHLNRHVLPCASLTPCNTSIAIGIGTRVVDDRLRRRAGIWFSLLHEVVLNLNARPSLAACWSSYSRYTMVWGVVYRVPRCLYGSCYRT